jgi:hypothetical protein
MRDRAHEEQITARDLRGTRPQRAAGALLGEPPEWDWDAGLSEKERAELAELRDSTDRQRLQLERKEQEITRATSEAQALRGGLRALADARLWRRRRVIALLRRQGLLD